MFGNTYVAFTLAEILSRCVSLSYTIFNSEVCLASLFNWKH